MKNFHYLLPFLILLATSSLSSKPKHPGSTSKPRLAAGDIAYVLAEHGLTLRIAAGVKSQKIKTLNHCDSVKIIGYDDPPETYSVNEFKGFDITGAWVKVLAGIDTGYVFDGYLSKWMCSKGDQEDFTKYFKKQFNATKKNHKVIKEWNNRNSTDPSSGLKLSNGISYDAGGSTAGGGCTIIIPDSLITLTEAYFVFAGPSIKGFPFEIAQRIEINGHNGAVNYKPVGGAIVRYGEMESVMIYRKGDKIIYYDYASD